MSNLNALQEMKRERDRLNDMVTAYGNKIREIDGERITAVKERDEARIEAQSWHDKYVLADTQRDDARAMLAEAVGLLRRRNRPTLQDANAVTDDTRAFLSAWVHSLWCAYQDAQREHRIADALYYGMAWRTAWAAL
jgi:uncharacterized coiled-coil DUF342 family protein